MALVSFLSICGIYLYGYQVESNLAVEEIVERASVAAPQLELPKAVDEKNQCKQLGIQYELQGIVFDHENTVALVQEIESGAMMLISNIEADRMKLTAAELSKVKVLQNGCSFTLYLNQPSDKDSHEISTHNITAS